MNKPNSILRIFYCYLILNFLVIFFNLFYCEFDIEIIKNFFENSFFSLILIIPCVLIRKDRYRVAYSLLSFVFFSITVLIESVYYLIFQVFLELKTTNSFFLLLATGVTSSYKMLVSPFILMRSSSSPSSSRKATRRCGEIVMFSRSPSSVMLESEPFCGGLA